jgi:hypothetical protein
VLLDTRLLRLNFGIFTLHMVQMAMFVVVPGLLVRYGDLPLASHWKVYLPAVLASFVLMVPAIILCRKAQQGAPVFVSAIAPVAPHLLVMWLRQHEFQRWWRAAC